MRRRTFAKVLGASGLAALIGCTEQEPVEKVEPTEPDIAEKPDAGKTVPAAAEVKDKPPYPDVTLCGNCGQVKGSPLCCKPGAATCEKCGLAAGSPGCCRIKKGEAATLCGKCGQIKGSEACCKEGAEKCGMCGLDKGSPGCCRISKAEVQKAALAMAAKA